MAELIELLFVVVPFAVYFVVGSYIEKKHFANIRAREARTMQVPMVTFGAKQQLPNSVETAMFVGSVVVSADYFKVFVAGLRNLVGGGGGASLCTRPSSIADVGKQSCA